jgi:hypothetical protein
MIKPIIAAIESSGQDRTRSPAKEITSIYVKNNADWLDQRIEIRAITLFSKLLWRGGQCEPSTVQFRFCPARC